MIIYNSWMNEGQNIYNLYNCSINKLMGIVLLGQMRTLEKKDTWKVLSKQNALNMNIVKHMTKNMDTDFHLPF